MNKQRNQKGNQKYLETNKNGNTIYQNAWDVAKAVKRKAYSYKCPH